MSKSIMRLIRISGIMYIVIGIAHDLFTILMGYPVLASWHAFKAE